MRLAKKIFPFKEQCCLQQLCYKVNFILLFRGVCKRPLREHCMPLFKRERILQLDDLLLIENCKLMHRINAETCPKTIVNLFDSVYITRSTQVNIVRHTNLMVNRSFLCTSVTDWNKLPVEQKHILNVKTFVLKLKTNMFDKY